MPIIKHEALAVTREELHAIRAELTQPYQYKLLERNDERILFLRTAREEPDPVTDLEACLEHAPDHAVRDLNHVVLLGGDRGALHVGVTSLRPLLERREHLDRAAVAHLRSTLAPEYGLGFHRVSGDPTHVLRIGLRIPRVRCLDLNEPDLLSLARALGPHLDDGSANPATIAYLVADEDHVRLPASELRADLGPRWDAYKNAPPPPPPRPAPAVHPEPEPPAPAPTARRRPQRSIRVRPALDFEAVADATPPEVDADPALLDDAINRLHVRLEHHGFEVVKSVAHGSDVFALAAERRAGYPHRVLVQTRVAFQRSDAILCAALVRELEADLLLVICTQSDPDAVRRTLATKVKVLTPRDAAAFQL